MCNIADYIYIFGGKKRGNDICKLSTFVVVCDVEVKIEVVNVVTVLFL